MIYKGTNSRHSVDGSTININLTKLDINSKIARPVYENNSNIEIEPFNIDKKWINEDFNADYNKPLREWYFSNFTTEEVINFRTLYYSFMEGNEINIYFFDWFEKYNRENNIIKTLNPLTKTTKTWKTLDNKIHTSKYPPTSTVKIAIEDVEIEACPFKTINEKEPDINKRDIKKLHSQLNFSNIMLETMSKQLTRIEDKDEPSSSMITSIPKPLVKPIYQLNTNLDTINLGNESDTKIEEIKELLSKLTLGKLSINTIDDLSLNKIKTTYPKTRTYYPRPSPADVLYEEKGELV
uniref:DUF7588 domain-containing protein n=1 Tax=Cajanus cajan TaxID=3821 RepID=A0A151SK08_CAJCA|nr:hypothetical protein KK1_001300 [Cajanus cajan]